MAKRIYRRLTDKYVEAVSHFAEGKVSLIWDDKVPGLQVRIGRRKITFAFVQEHRIRGKRGVTYQRLGFFPSMDVKAARKAALIEAGRVAAGRITPGHRTAVKVAAAMDAYVAYLREKAAGKGKAPAWAKNVESIARVHVVPEFGNWSLAELSAAPGAVAKWHRGVTKSGGPIVANQSARVLRAAYRRAARLDRSLPPALPTSAVEFNPEQRSQNALAPADFPKWRKAWAKIEAPTRRAFQMINLLAGCRPGELARLRWPDVEPRKRCFVIRGAKADNDVYVPMSAAIAREFKRARDAARADKIETEWVFPARAGGHLVKVDADRLPACGMALRRTWRTVAADCGVDELIAHFCLGHVPAGISRGYVAKMILSSGSAMRTAQRTVSRRMLALMA
jgi:integrase